jgi:hypothetical protein
MVYSVCYAQRHVFERDSLERAALFQREKGVIGF